MIAHVAKPANEFASIDATQFQALCVILAISRSDLAICETEPYSFLPKQASVTLYFEGRPFKGMKDIVILFCKLGYLKPNHVEQHYLLLENLLTNTLYPSLLPPSPTTDVVQDTLKIEKAYKSLLYYLGSEPYFGGKQLLPIDALMYAHLNAHSSLRKLVAYPALMAYVQRVKSSLDPDAFMHPIKEPRKPYSISVPIPIWLTDNLQEHLITAAFVLGSLLLFSAHIKK